MRLRAVFGVVLAAALLVGARVVTVRMDRARADALITDAGRVAQVALARAQDGLAVQLDGLRLTAVNAASSPRLSAATRGRVDAATLNDLFENEPWWEPYRGDLSVAVYYDLVKPVLDSRGLSNRLDLRALVAQARSGQTPAPLIARYGNDVFAVAAGAVRGGSAPPVLVVGRPVGDEVLRSMAERAGAALVLATDDAVLASAGPPSEVRALQDGFHAARTASGGGGAAPRPEDPVLASFQLAPGVRVWTFGRTPPALATQLGSSPRRNLAIWGAAGLLAVVCVGMGLGIGGRRNGGRRAVVDPSVLQRGVAQGLLLPAVGAPDGLGTLGRYRLIERIGEGGMAEIFTAVSFGSNGFRRPFVIKRLRPEMVGNEQAVAQFIDEANLQSALVHPNIVPVFDFGQTGREYFLAQEYVPGRDAGRVTRRLLQRGEAPMSLRATAYLAHEVLRALEYAHSRCDDEGRPLGIVHRDVTPENIIISSRGEVKLLDFGIAKSDQVRVTRTELGLVKGNVDFMSPEQARGLAVDARSDLFCVGLVIHSCLAARPLYSGDTLYDRLTRAAVGVGPDEQALLDMMPDVLHPILTRALARDPAQRYGTAAEFRADLEPHVVGGAEELAHLVNGLFEDELRAEVERLAGVALAVGRVTPETVAAS